MSVPIKTAEPVEAAATPSLARRRLLQAATGALPSVLTLSSGAAAAAASTLHCLAPPSEMPERFVPTDDNWVRAQVRVAEYENRRAYCVTSPSNACVDPNFHAAPGSHWVVDGNTMTAGMSNDIHVLSDRSYGLVYVNQQGSVMTLDSASSVNMLPVTDSCWHSMIGSRTSSLG